MKKRDAIPHLTPELVLNAYCSGYFPMADPLTGEVSWYSPDPRAIVPLDGFKASRSLRGKVKREVFTLRFNTACESVIRHCAERDETWISGEIVAVYARLHEMGYVHSVESWNGGLLAGGLYGIAIGGAFFGESMFSRETDASKVAMVHLVARLRERGFRLLDTQFMNDHIRQFGACEIPRPKYMRLLREALVLNTAFVDPPVRQSSSAGAPGLP